MSDEARGDDTSGPFTEDDEFADLRAVLLVALEKRLGLPQGYIMSLHSEPSDWASIVKLGVLVEATLTEYIVLELGNPKLFAVGKDEGSLPLTPRWFFQKPVKNAHRRPLFNICAATRGEGRIRAFSWLSRRIQEQHP
jgi:hypothetical protein